MRDSADITILVAEDNDVNRAMLVGLLSEKNYQVIEARDGREAAHIAKNQTVDLAVIDQMMAPEGGFDFARAMKLHNIAMPMIMVTAHQTSDLLVEANKHNIQHVLQKPVIPERFLGVIERVTRHLPPRRGNHMPSSEIIAPDAGKSVEELMQLVIRLAEDNVRQGKGGPFGAVVADADGHVLGQGVSGITSRSDPTAHAEVMAIRQATEKLGKTGLEGCVMVCSSEPTDIGKALIRSVGIDLVHYGLSRAEVAAEMTKAAQKDQKYKPSIAPDVQYVQTGQYLARDLFNRWLARDDKIFD